MMSRFKSILKGWINYYKDKLGLIPPSHKQLFDSRLKVCRSNECGMLKLGICTACGCPVRKKTKVLSETCPENMWNPIYYSYNNVDFIIVDELPDELREKFLEWSIGQTCPVIPDVKQAAYTWDWERFIYGLEGKKTVWD